MKQTRNRQNPMVLVSLRMPKQVLDYFQQYPSYTMKMREVLEKHAKEVGQSQER